nr:NADH dehydrogenase subunit 2 [Amblyomma sp.]BCW91246.1 NADH dehydrogenase subunit 2 [Amblyomma sp.]BCW91259.1 NADH dehydrogenase subunit 2 [Amblyomma sp.]BCW91272.1 NADH dehydrogenase subunit 2 [Amblyomma sp.]BCW91285.1 NADH dehydrogenase subunit 2 [Amblyomma sp.]
MFFKNFLKWIIIITIIITISSNSWFMYWLMMELNLLAFIPIMNSKKKNNSNCMITYFIIQTFSSTVFLISILNMNILDFYFFNLSLMISLMIKLAIIPFHFWLTHLSEMIDFKSLFLILTVQKFIPLFILSLFLMKIIIIFAMISSIFGSIFVINLKSLKKILIFSSISHQGWMISLILVKSNFWISYLIIYSFLIFKITYLFNKNKFYTTNNLFFNKKMFFEKISTLMLMLSLGGMPPFMGFIAKMISIIIIMNNNNIIILILIISSIINIFIYLRMMNPHLFINLINFKNYFKNALKYKNLIMNINMMITIFVINLII